MYNYKVYFICSLNYISYSCYHFRLIYLYFQQINTAFINTQLINFQMFKGSWGRIKKNRLAKLINGEPPSHLKKGPYFFFFKYRFVSLLSTFEYCPYITYFIPIPIRLINYNLTKKTNIKSTLWQ